ncbi:MAG: phage holin family protein [Verrucomicrobia bacterium]|nr:phage holin family protein [Verrucomicrobiota bacterium]
MSKDKEQSQPTRTKRFIQSWLINTLAVLVAERIVDGISFEKGNLWTPIVTALVLGILNYFIRPIMMLLALPLLIFTLGLFTLVINAALLYLVGSLLKPHFVVDSFWAAFLGAVIISIVSVTLQIITGTGKSRVTFTRGQRPPPGPGNDDKGGGPVIDV